MIGNHQQPGLSPALPSPMGLRSRLLNQEFPVASLADQFNFQSEAIFTTNTKAQLWDMNIPGRQDDILDNTALRAKLAHYVCCFAMEIVVSQWKGLVLISATGIFLGERPQGNKNSNPHAESGPCVSESLHNGFVDWFPDALQHGSRRSHSREVCASYFPNPTRYSAISHRGDRLRKRNHTKVSHHSRTLCPFLPSI